MVDASMCAYTFSVVFSQACFKITRNTGIVDGLIRLAYEDINAKEFFHLLACQAVVFGALSEKLNTQPASTSLRRGSLRFSLRSKAKAGPTRIRTWDQGIMSPLL